MSNFHLNFQTSSNPLYICFKYPAGEYQYRLTDMGIKELREATQVVIWTNDGMFEDWVQRLALLVSAIHAINPTIKVMIVLPYLPYSRADRRFVEGDCLGLQRVYDLLHCARVSQIITYDPHNPSVKFDVDDVQISPEGFFKKSIVDFVGVDNAITVLWPDKGAAERYGGLLPAILEGNTKRIKIQQLNCLKKRNPSTGVFEGFEVPGQEIKNHKVLVLDDICDGGGTFVGIADELAKSHCCQACTKQVLGLATSHGIYSKGPEELVRRFTKLYTTNTLPLKDNMRAYVTRFSVSIELLEAANANL